MFHDNYVFLILQRLVRVTTDRIICLKNTIALKTFLFHCKSDVPVITQCKRHLSMHCQSMQNGTEDGRSHGK